MALQRLAARRGTPQVVYSDNGTNFRGADKELKDATASMDRAKIEEYALSKRVKWVFNPPDAPHMGGAWERLIRSVKTALNVILREQAPSKEVLSTLFAEAEHSVNSRPLTHVSLDPCDKEALTPNHFLIGSSSGEIQLGRYDLQNVCLRRQWRTAQSFAEAFWKRWLREYLATLVLCKKWTEKERPLEVGDIVLIVDLQAPRNSWRKGTVIRVFEESGHFGVERVQEISVTEASGENKESDKCEGTEDDKVETTDANSDKVVVVIKENIENKRRIAVVDKNGNKCVVSNQHVGKNSVQVPGKGKDDEEIGSDTQKKKGKEDNIELYEEDITYEEYVVCCALKTVGRNRTKRNNLIKIYRLVQGVGVNIKSIRMTGFSRAEVTTRSRKEANELLKRYGSKEEKIAAFLPRRMKYRRGIIFE
nr:PREDICTED: uncharacterized protein LOC105663531 [Megachile rotundata]